MSLPTTCPVDESGPALWVTLDDGTTYCTVHKGLVADEAEVPSSATVELLAAIDDDDTPDTIASLDRPPDAQASETAEAPRAHVPRESEAASAASVIDPSPADQVETTTDHGAAVPSPGESEPNYGALKLIIGLTLSAGLRSLDADNNPVEPPTGWMPPPASDIPEVEAGAAMAVAVMIRTFGIDHADMIGLAKQFLDTDNETETTQ